MKSRFLKFVFAGVSLVFGVRGIAPAQAPQTSAPQKKIGVTGAFEGWFKNPDGSFTLLLGYFNRDDKQEIEIPIGTNNRIDPGGPDRGQPTHFLPMRQWGMFGVRVPAGFGQNRIAWTISANGKTSVIPASLHPDYEISPFHEDAVGNTPPLLSFDDSGPTVQGPLGLTISRTTAVATPLTLTVFVSDDEKWTTLSGVRPRSMGTPVTIHWTRYRGTGEVTFSQDRPPVEKIEPKAGAKFSGKATVTAKFSEPGDYILHVVANDYSGDGGGGEQCCWSFGDVKVLVKP